jgi:hypothetical protein
MFACHGLFAVDKHSDKGIELNYRISHLTVESVSKERKKILD